MERAKQLVEKILLIPFITTLVLLYSCKQDKIEPSDPKDPESEKPVDPPIPQIELSESFSELFTSDDLNQVATRIRSTREDFRYYNNFPSITDRNKTVMMLRIDPLDAAGIKRGATISAKKQCFYGSYSACLRLPNTTKVQPDLGACAALVLANEEKEIAVELRLSDPTSVYVLSPEEEHVKLNNFNANSKFYIYGIDWTESTIVFWVKYSDNAEKTILKEMSNENFKDPATYSFNYYHSKLKPVTGRPNSLQAPLYPYELELDRLEYASIEKK